MTAHEDLVRLLTNASHAAAEAEPSEASRIVLDLLDMLSNVVAAHGPEVAVTTLRLAPIALAKGDSRRALYDWLDRAEQGQRSSAVICLDQAQRFPTNVAFTGQLALTGLAFSA